MTDFQKTLYVADAICDCIPLVSTVTNVSEALYKLAHRVDAVSPVTPGRATSLKIHVLDKNLLDCFVGAIPIFGNVVRFIQLVIWALSGFKIFDPLVQAISRNKRELLHLCLGNRPLSPEAADHNLGLASTFSNLETVQKILGHSNNFTADGLILALNPLNQHDALTAAKAAAILGRWNVLGMQLPQCIYAIPRVLSAAEPFLANGNPSLASRILAILPENSLSLEQAQPFLDSYDDPDLPAAHGLNADQYSSLLSKLSCLAASQLAASPDTSLYTLQRLLALRTDLSENFLLESLFPPQESAPLEKYNKAKCILAYLGEKSEWGLNPTYAIPALFRLAEGGENDLAKQLRGLLPASVTFQDIANHVVANPNLQKWRRPLLDLWTSREPLKT